VSDETASQDVTLDLPRRSPRIRLGVVAILPAGYHGVIWLTRIVTRVLVGSMHCLRDMSQGRRQRPDLPTGGKYIGVPSKGRSWIVTSPLFYQVHVE